MATYNELLQRFRAIAPQSVLAKDGTPEFGDIFNQWTSDLEKEFGVQGWDAIPADQLDQIEFDEAGVPAGPATPNTSPDEQNLYNRIVPGLEKQIDADAGRQTEVEAAGRQIDKDANNLRTVFDSAASRFDGQAYLAQNPDVREYYQALPAGPNGGRIFNGQEMSPADFAKFHYEQSGRAEGRSPAYTSDNLRTNLENVNTTTNTLATNANTAAASQLAALTEATGKLQGILSGGLAEQAAALAQATATLEANIGTLDAAQRKALADEIAAKQQNLETSIASQQASLTQQVADLQGNASAAAAARRQALEQQIAELTAAQAPVSEARLRGAEALTTAINIGLEGTRDQLKADAAREGFVGGSTMQDANLVRATIGARQQAAQAGAQARTENAVDTRAIGQLGAGGRYSIADAFAGQTNAIQDFGATGRGTLRTGLATGTQAIGDYGATGRRTIADSTSGARSGLGQWNALTGYGNKDAGIKGGMDIAGRVVTGAYDIKAALAKQAQDIANQNATMTAAYKANLFPESTAAGQAALNLTPATITAKTSFIPYGTAGTTNALNTLGWWGGNATPPTTNVTLTQPNNSGSEIAKLGAGLTSAGLSLWQTPKTTKPAATGSGSPATYWNGTAWVPET